MGEQVKCHFLEQTCILVSPSRIANSAITLHADLCVTYSSSSKDGPLVSPTNRYATPYYTHTMEIR